MGKSGLIASREAFHRSQNLAGRACGSPARLMAAMRAAISVAASHEPTLTPSLSHRMGEGVRRTGEGYFHLVQGPNAFQNEKEALHELPPACSFWTAVASAAQHRFRLASVQALSSISTPPGALAAKRRRRCALSAQAKTGSGVQSRIRSGNPPPVAALTELALSPLVPPPNSGLFGSGAPSGWQGRRPPRPE